MWQLEPEISPEIDWIPTPLKDDIGLTIFANSITLTPGTVTTNVRADGMVQVHALTKEGIQQIRDGVGYSKVAKIIKKKEQVK
ncbi:MAG: mnhE [Rickettsiaceae bacterium]|nr:mnhE [Rickettsiaceae bacterium]